MSRFSLVPFHTLIRNTVGIGVVALGCGTFFLGWALRLYPLVQRAKSLNHTHALTGLHKSCFAIARCMTYGSMDSYIKNSYRVRHNTSCFVTSTFLEFIVPHIVSMLASRIHAS